MDAHLLDKLAATEYAIYSSPDHLRQSRFGKFVRIPDFPTRWDANQMFDLRCEEHETNALLFELEKLYRGTSATFRKVAFHDAATAEHLPATLLAQGWDCQRHWMMTHGVAAEVRTNPRISIRSVAFDAAELGAIYEDAEELRYRRSQDMRIGGEALIGEIDGVPAGATGWFVVDGIARFRQLHTVPNFRRLGVAVALMCEVIRRAKSCGIELLCIHCPERGPLRLYRRLGFENRGVLWYCVRQDVLPFKSD